MELVILHNDFDDCVLYIGGKAYQDIDHTWAECMMWLDDTISGFSVELRHVDLHRSEYPDEVKSI